jgi:hypothetical protein
MPPNSRNDHLDSQFEITDDSEAVQMLQRSTQIGEFYVLGPPV